MTPARYEFEEGGKAYSLRLDVNAMIAAQSAVGIEDDAEFWATLSTRLGSSLALLRALFFRGMKPLDLGIVAAGRLITDLGTLRAVEIMTNALRLALPPPRKDARPADPGKADPFRWSDVFAGAARAGISPLEAGGWTLREIAVATEAFRWRQESAERRALRAAWYTAVLGRAEKVPRLDTFMRQCFPPPPIDSVEGIAAGVRAWAGGLGLTVTRHARPVR